MKLIVFKYIILSLLLSGVLLITSQYYKNNDLIMNFSDSFVKRFDNNKNFIIYTNDLIDKIKLRIKEKLIHSFILRIEREKNAENHLKSIKSKISNTNNIIDNSLMNNQTRQFFQDEYSYIADKLNISEKGFINNLTYNLERIIDVNNVSLKNITKSDLSDLIKYDKKKYKRLINLLENIKYSKKFIDFTNVFLDSDENFQSKFSEAEILQNLKLLNDFKKSKKLNNKTKSHFNKIKYEHLFNITIQDKSSEVNLNISISNKSFLMTSKDHKDIKINNSNSDDKLFLKKKEAIAEDIKSSSTKNDMKKEELNREIKSLNLINVNYNYSDIVSTRRKIRFFVDLENDCNVYINDTLIYNNKKDSDIVDHLILHNDVDDVEPRSISSEKKAINYFIFNRKLNMFSVNLDDNYKEKDYSLLDMDSFQGDNGDYDITYEYMANRLIKIKKFSSKNLTNKNITDINNSSNSSITLKNNLKAVSSEKTFDNEDSNFFLNNYYNYLENNLTSLLFGDSYKKLELLNKNIKKFNEFVWKINNENIDKNIYLELEFLFSLGNDFDYDKIKFNFKTSRSEMTIFDRNFQVFEWKGTLLPYEVKNIRCAFPLAFNTCGNKINFDISIFFLTSLFLIIIVLTIYLLTKYNN